MKRILALLLLLAAAPPGRAVETNAQPRSPAGTPEFEHFHLIAERNIFNPNRSGRSDNTTRRRETERPPPALTFALLGTMSYEKGRFAFFDGSNSDFRKVLKPDDTIAGFKITGVAPTCVKLEGTNGRTIDLCVGMHMSKRDEDDWRVHEPANDLASTANGKSEESPETNDVLKRLMQRRTEDGGDSASTAPAPAPAPAPIPALSSSAGETDEVIKRLLQKREQELNK